MYVVIESFIVSMMLWLIEAVLFGYFLRNKSWKVYLPTQLALIVLIWPTTQIAFEVIFYLDTIDVKANTVSDLELTSRLPSECQDIIYHKDPTGRWFYCAISEDLAYSWLKENKFQESGSSYCGRYEVYPQVIESLLNSNKTKHYVTELKPNGAGSSASVTKEGMYLCQWYW